MEAAFRPEGDAIRVIVNQACCGCNIGSSCLQGLSSNLRRNFCETSGEILIPDHAIWREVHLAHLLRHEREVVAQPGATFRIGEKTCAPPIKVHRAMQGRSNPEHLQWTSLSKEYIPSPGRCLRRATEGGDRSGGEATGASTKSTPFALAHGGVSLRYSQVATGIGGGPTPTRRHVRARAAVK